MLGQHVIDPFVRPPGDRMDRPRYFSVGRGTSWRSCHAWIWVVR
jgi:hypothetical protein